MISVSLLSVLSSMIPFSSGVFLPFFKVVQYWLTLCQTQSPVFIWYWKLALASVQTNSSVQNARRAGSARFEFRSILKCFMSTKKLSFYVLFPHQARESFSSVKVDEIFFSSNLVELFGISVSLTIFLLLSYPHSLYIVS